MCSLLTGGSGGGLRELCSWHEGYDQTPLPEVVARMGGLTLLYTANTLTSISLALIHWSRHTRLSQWFEVKKRMCLTMQWHQCLTYIFWYLIPHPSLKCLYIKIFSSHFFKEDKKKKEKTWTDHKAELWNIAGRKKHSEHRWTEDTWV